MKKWLRNVAALVVLVTMIVIPLKTSNGSVYAAAKKTDYITAKEFVGLLLKSMKMKVDQTVENPYISAALQSGIMCDGDVKDLDGDMTRAECAVLLDRADEYLHKERLEEKYIERVMKKRISDIKEIPKEQRRAVAKVYGRGIIRGTKLGWCIQSRAFHGLEKLTKADAKVYIYKTMHPSARAKMSPDGQLIRTTNLPKNADKYEYILESFPNSFYEKKFRYQYYTYSSSPLREGEAYVFPKDIPKTQYKTFFRSFNMGELMEEYLWEWNDYVEEHIKTVFNVDYNTIGQEWLNQLSKSTHFGNAKVINKRYIEGVKEYKVKVNLKRFAVEPSSLYFSDGYFIRAYVEFKVTASENTRNLRDYLWGFGGNIKNFEINKWMKCYLDFEICNIDMWGDGSTIRAYPVWYNY